MSVISIDVEDNESELDAVKQQVSDASAALSSAIEAGQVALAALQAFKISFSVNSVAPSAAPASDPGAAPLA